MNLKEKLTENIKAAMKSGDVSRTGILRLLASAIHNKEIDLRSKGAQIDDTVVMQVLQGEAKKRSEAIQIYAQNSRNDLKEKEEAELKVIKEYLPQEMESGEVERVVRAIIGHEGIKDFGGAMKAVMKDLRGKADSRVITEAVKKVLGGS